MKYTGWLKERIEAANKEVSAWPEWERRCTESCFKKERPVGKHNNSNKP